MANAYSVPLRMSKYIDPIDNESLNRVLDIKEGRYNSNKAQVEQAIAQFSSIDLARDKDKEYLYNNLKTVIDIVDDTDNIDFSRTGLGSELGLYISQAIDKNVLKQAANTKSIRNYGANLEELKKKKPELYSQINDNDARVQGGYYEYMKGEKDDLGSLNYVNFTDVQSNIMKKAKGLKDLSPDSVIKVPDGKGYFVEKQVKGLTQSEWLKVLPTMFTEQDRSQLAINGRVRYGYNDKAAMADVNRMKQVNNEKLSKSIDNIDAKIELIADEATVNKLKVEKKQVTDYYNKTNSSYDLIGQTAGKIGGFFLEQELIGGMASSFGATESIEYSEDGAYWKRMKQDAEKKSKLVTGNTFNDLNKDGAADFSTTATAVETKDIGKVLKTKEDLQRAEEIQFNKDLAFVYNNMSPENKKFVDSEEKTILLEHEKRMRKDSSLKPLTDIELHREVIDRVSLGDNSVLTLQQKIDLKSQMDQIDNYNLRKNEAFEKTENNLLVKNSEEIFEELKSNPNTLMFGTDSEGLTFNDLLLKKDINNKEDLSNFLSSNSEEAKVFKANYLVQTIKNLGSLGEVFNSANPFTTVSEDKLFTFDRDVVRRLYRAKELIGENKDITDVIEFLDYDTWEPLTEEQILSGEKQHSTFARIKDKDSKFAKLIKNSATVKDNDNYGSDKSLRSDSHLYKVLNQDEFTKEYERVLNFSTANITGQNIITIQPSGTRADEVVPAYQELLTKASLQFIPDKSKPLHLEKNKDGSYTLFQNQKGDKETPIKTVGGTIPQSEIVKLSNLNEQIDLYENKAAIDFNTQIRSEVPLLNYASSNARNSQQLQNLYNASTPQGRAKIMMASKDNVLDYLGTNLPEMNKKQKGPDYVSMVQKTLANPNKFSLKMDSYEGVSNVVIQMTNQEGEKVDIDSIDLSNNIDQKEFMDIYYATPQVFLTLALQNIGTEYIKTNNSSKIDLINNNL